MTDVSAFVGILEARNPYTLQFASALVIVAHSRKSFVTHTLGTSVKQFFFLVYAFRCDFFNLPGLCPFSSVDWQKY
jgi:hypothetical protein